MHPFPNSPSSEPTRVELVYASTPEQQEMQRRAQRRVRGASRLFPVFMLFFVLAFLVVVAGGIFVVVEIATHLPH